MKPKVTHDTARAIQQVGMVPDVVADATRQAVNEVARLGRRALMDAMASAFSRPTPYTLNAIRVEEAKEAGPLEAAVMVKGRQDAQGGAIPQEAFLRAQILGGSRRFKRFEILLWRRGYLPRQRYAVPAKYARLDAYGNMSRGQIIEILAYFSAFPPARGERRKGFRNNTTDAGRAKRRQGTRNRQGFEYFVQPVGATGLAPGIYRRELSGGRFVGPAQAMPRMVVAFVKSPAYTKRLLFWDELERLTDKELADRIDASVDRMRRRRRVGSL